jgi:hypothetical protein
LDKVFVEEVKSMGVVKNCVGDGGFEVWVDGLD